MHVSFDMSKATIDCLSPIIMWKETFKRDLFECYVPQLFVQSTPRQLTATTVAVHSIQIGLFCIHIVSFDVFTATLDCTNNRGTQYSNRSLLDVSFHMIIGLFFIHTVFTGLFCHILTNHQVDAYTKIRVDIPAKIRDI